MNVFVSPGSLTVPRNAPLASEPERPPSVEALGPGALGPESRQATTRLTGRVVYCDGARATVATVIGDADQSAGEDWAIGRLVTINLGRSRIAGLIYGMEAGNSAWAERGENVLYTKLELVGEVLDHPDGTLSFRRGITTYPYVGAEAHRIRARDLRTIFDLGARGGSEIGRLSQDHTIAASINIEDMLRKHFAVVGTTGVGKSTAVSLLVQAAVDAKPDLRVLILDPHNEYAHVFGDQAVTLEAAHLNLPFWTFRFDELSDVIYRNRVGLEDERDVLRELIVAAKLRFKSGDEGPFSGSLLRRPIDAKNGEAGGAGITADTPIPYRMTDLAALIEDALGKLDPKHDRAALRAIKVKLEGLARDPRYRFMFSGPAADETLERVLAPIFRIPHRERRVCVFQLAGIPSEVVNAVASVLSRMAFEVAMWSGGAFEVLLLCEEAHRYVPQDQSHGFAPTRAAIARIAKEGRKYGCYLGIITQRPGELDPTILSQCSTVFAMRLGNDRDQEIIRSAIADSSASTIGFLSSIGNREAIAFGEGVATPMRMTFQVQAASKLPTRHGDEGGALVGKREVNLREVGQRMRGLMPGA